MEPEASEFPKGLVHYGSGHVYIRHITPSPLVDVGCHNPPHLRGTRRPRRHICTERYSGSDTKLSHPSLGSAVARYCSLWAYHSLTILFLGTHTRTSQWVTHPRNVLAQTRLTSEFQWNPKPMSSHFPKGLVLYGSGHVHIRHITPYPLVDVGCHNIDGLFRYTYI